MDLSDALEEEEEEEASDNEEQEEPPPLSDPEPQPEPPPLSEPEPEQEQLTETYLTGSTEPSPEVETLFASPYINEERAVDEPPDQDYLSYIQELMTEEGLDFQGWLEEIQIPTEPEEAEPQWPQEEEEEKDQIDYTPTARPPPKKIMGVKSFRYLETRILANFIKDSEDERMAKIKDRLGFMKKVKAPSKASLSVIHEKKSVFEETESKEEAAVELEVVL